MPHFQEGSVKRDDKRSASQVLMGGMGQSAGETWTVKPHRRRGFFHKSPSVSSQNLKLIPDLEAKDNGPKTFPSP